MMSVSPSEQICFQIDQISAIEEAFAHFDQNKDGLISVKEFQQILTSFGENVTDDEIRDQIFEWDGDGDGHINFTEFLIAMTKILIDINNEDRLREAFNMFDKDSNGYITPAELANVMTNLGHILRKEEINEMIQEADLDSDGKISFHEFKKLMNS